MRNILNICILICAILILTSCTAPVGNGTQGTGEFKEAQKFIQRSVGSDVTEFEQVQTKHIEAWTWNNGINIDGAQFWKGNNKDILAHDIIYFRGYSSKLDSYVFLQYNDAEDTKSYYTLYNYNVKDIEKAKTIATKVKNNVESVLKKHSAAITDIKYQLYTEENTLDEVFKQPKDFLEDKTWDNFKSSPQLFILLTVDTDMETIRKLKDNIIGCFEKDNYTVSVCITTKDNETATFTCREAFLSLEGGMSTYLN